MDEQQSIKQSPISSLGEKACVREDVCVSEAPYKGRLREIHIQPLDIGFVVRLGCQSLVITNKKQLLEELTNYFDNPNEVERRYYAGEFGDKNSI